MIFLNIKMPKNCDVCPCCYRTEGAFSDECQATGNNLDEYFAEFNKKYHQHNRNNDFEFRPDWCPLLEFKVKESIRETLIEELDTNCGYCDEERADILADRLIASGLIVKDANENIGDIKEM